MSFIESQHFSDFEEERNKGTREKPADGTEVGTPDSQKLDTAENKDKENEQLKITLEAYKENKDVAMKKVENAKVENPDWPPAKGNPEAENKLAGDLEAGMNNIV